MNRRDGNTATLIPVVFIALIAFIGIHLSAGVLWAQVLPGGRVSYKLSLRSGYDSNILRYSPRDFNRARDGSERFRSPVKALDDMRNDVRLSATYRFKLAGVLDGRVRSTINFANYLRNPINNAGWVSISWLQRMSDELRFLVYHFYEPYYFLRDYTDNHTAERHHCDFALDKSYLKLFFRPVRELELTGRYEFKRYAYNEYFTEYEGDRHELSAAAVFRTAGWRLDLGYGLGWFDNSGFNPADLLSIAGDEDTEVGDGNYEEDTYSLSVERSFKVVKRRIRLGINLSLADRYYTTMLTPDRDPIHHGRRDVLSTASFKVTFPVNRDVDLGFNLTSYRRDSRASSDLVHRIKDYTRTVWWMEVSYEFE